MTSIQSPVPAEPSPPRAAGTGPVLTPREHAALLALMLGYTQVTGARRLGCSARTLRRTIASAVDRLGACSPTHAVVLAVEAGQLDRDARELPAWPEKEPPWPDGRPGHRQVVEAAERRARFARLLAQDVPPKVAAARLGVTVPTANRYRRQLRQEAAVPGAP